MIKQIPEKDLCLSRIAYGTDPNTGREYGIILQATNLQQLKKLWIKKNYSHLDLSIYKRLPKNKVRLGADIWVFDRTWDRLNLIKRIK